MLKLLPHPAQAARRAKASLLRGALHAFAAFQPLAGQGHAQAVLVVDDAQAGMLGTHGRLDDMLIIKGVNIFPSDVEAVVRALEGFNGEYRLVVEREQHLDRLRVEAERADASPHADGELAAQLARQLKAVTGVSAEVSVLATGLMLAVAGTCKAAPVIAATSRAIPTILRQSLRLGVNFNVNS